MATTVGRLEEVRQSVKRIQAEGVGGSMPIVTDKDCSKLPRAARIVCFEPDRRVEIEVIMPKTAENK